MSWWPAASSACADHADLAVHHAAGAEQVGARVGLGHGHLRVDGEGGVVVDAAALVEHAAVAVVGELVEAGVGHDDGVVADLGPHVAQRHVEHAVGVDAGAAPRVATGGHAEEHQAADARRDRLRGRLAQRLAGVLHDAGHGRDRHRLVDALADEQGQHELAGPQVGLGDEPTHRGRGTQPPGPVGGEHRWTSARTTLLTPRYPRTRARDASG